MAASEAPLSSRLSVFSAPMPTILHGCRPFAPGAQRLGIARLRRRIVIGRQSQRYDSGMAKGELSDFARRQIEAVRRGWSQQLNLSNQGLYDIPGEIFGLTALEGLDLSGNNLRAIPESICHLRKLKTLNV